MGVERYISIVVGRMARLERASYNGTAGGGDEGKKRVALRDVASRSICLGKHESTVTDPV